MEHNDVVSHSYYGGGVVDKEHVAKYPGVDKWYHVRFDNGKQFNVLESTLTLVSKHGSVDEEVKKDFNSHVCSFCRKPIKQLKRMKTFNGKEYHGRCLKNEKSV